MELSKANLTLIDLVKQQESSTPFIQEVHGVARTFGEVDHNSDAWATALRHNGIHKGDSVISFLPTCATTVELWLGIAKAGAIEVPLNTGLQGPLLHHQVSDSKAEIVVVSSEHLRRFVDMPDTQLHRIVVFGDIPDDHGQIDPRVVCSRDFLRNVQVRQEPFATPDLSDTASIIYTSGTTGSSKGVIVSWAQIAATVQGSIPVGDLTANDAYYNPFPLFHIGGKFPIALAAELGSRVVLRDGFSTWEFWSDVAATHCTTTLLLGATANFLYQQPRRDDDAETPLRNVVMVPLMHQYEDFAKRFGVRICTTFNMTEVSAPLSSEGWQPANNKTSGHARRGYQCRVVDSADETVPPNVPGELVVRADDRTTLNGGYWGNADATADAWRNGWFHTGDIFKTDEAGEFYFVDRLKDSIRRRGENISSSEVESIVVEHEDVEECAAHAVPSEWGEDEVKIVVVLKSGRTLTAEGLIDFLEPRLASFMVPRYVEFMTALPKTPTQKIRKITLRDRGITDATWDRTAQTRPPARVES